MSLPKRNHDMMLPLNRVARSYEAPTGQAIGAFEIHAATSSGFDSAERFLKTPVIGHAMQVRIALSSEVPLQ
jgi:hypothetical protein